MLHKAARLVGRSPACVCAMRTAPAAAAAATATSVFGSRRALRGVCRPLSSSTIRRQQHQQAQEQQQEQQQPSSDPPPAAAPAAAASSVLVNRLPIPGHNAGLLVVTLNRPKQTNALTTDLLHDLQGIFDKLPNDKWVRAVVLTGAGHAFCGGHDLYQMHGSQGNQHYFEKMFARCSRFMLSIQRVPQPVIAAVNGLATGAGCQLVAACDLAIASERAQFGTSGVKLGLFCATPSVPLSRNVSRKRAFEMLVTGDFIDAETARDFGLVNHVVRHEDLDDAVQKLVRDIADKPAVAISMGKSFFYNQLERPITQAYDMADFTMAQNIVSRDTEEGISAFVEKRRPDWDL